MQFQPIEVFMEILSNCLGQKCLSFSIIKEGHLYSRENFYGTLDNREKHKGLAQQIYHAYSMTNSNGMQQISCDTWHDTSFVYRQKWMLVIGPQIKLLVEHRTQFFEKRWVIHNIRLWLTTASYDWSNSKPIWLCCN